MGSALSSGDAVSNHILEIERRLSAWGFSTRIFGSSVDPALRSIAELDVAYQTYMDNQEDVLFYHYSSYCDNHLLYQRSRNRKVLVYHNITPARHYAPYDAWYESVCSRGRAILPRLKDCDLALGVSEYNRQELLDSGFPSEQTGVLPLFLGVADLKNAARHEALFRRLKSGGMRNVLFVGRVAPNKAFEDLIKIFYHYHRYLSPKSRLVLVGPRFLPRYDGQLDALVERLGLADTVVFTDRVPLRELKTYYEAADLFLCTSRHEGFCIPLLESMYFGVPILARAETGVPYTLGPAGVRFHHLDYAVLAETMHMLIEDQNLRQQVIATQNERLDDFATRKVEGQLRAVLQVLALTVPEDATRTTGA
jgi:glycosyltransferase involved in cell wall biosynthesis